MNSLGHGAPLMLSVHENALTLWKLNACSKQEQQAAKDSGLVHQYQSRAYTC